MRKLLIVDDAPTNRIRLGHLAISLGCEVVFASDGERALTLLEDNPGISCVVTDCQMPNLDGPAMIRRIRESGMTLPIFVYSAYRTVLEVSALLEVGATCFLSYPVEREILKEYLERHTTV